MKRSVVLAVAACALLSCQIFAVRMPTFAHGGSSIAIEVDVRAPTDADDTQVNQCTLLPNGWVLTAATYTRTLSGSGTTSGTLADNAAMATTLNGGPDATPGYTWKCLSFPTADYAGNDYATAFLSVTVANTAGTYSLRFGVPNDSGELTNSATRRIAIDQLPDWRFDSRPLASVSDLATWTAITSTGADSFIAVDAAGALHTTTNGGATWVDTQITAGGALNAVAQVGSITVVVGDDGLIYSRASSVPSFTQRTSGTTQDLNTVCTDGQHVFAAGDGGTVLASLAGGTWQVVTDAALGDVRDCVAVVGYGAFAVATNGYAFRMSASETHAPLITDSVDLGGTLYTIAYFYRPDVTLYAMGANGMAFSRPITGGTWTSFVAPTSGIIGRLRIEDDIMYASSGVSDSNDDDGALWVAPIGASSWTNIGSGTTMTVNGIAVTNRAVLYVGTNGLRSRIGVPRLTFETSYLDVGRTDVGASLNATINMTNTGTAALYLGNLATTGPFTATAPCAQSTLAPAASCTITVVMTPTANGTLSGTLTFANNGIGNASVELAGHAGAVQSIAISNDAGGADPLTVAFGATAIGSTATRHVVIRNNGNEPLLIGPIGTVISAAAPFAIASDACSDQSLAGGAECTLAITFAPTAMTSYTGAFDVPSNDAAHPSTFVQLSGDGAAPADIEIAALRLPDTQVGSTGEGALAISNLGTGPLNIRSLAVDGTEFTFADSAAFTVAAGATEQRLVRFSPTEAGERTATVTLTTNDPDEETVTVVVSGNGYRDDAGDDGGCSAAGPSTWAMLGVMLLWVRRRGCLASL